MLSYSTFRQPFRRALLTGRAWIETKLMPSTIVETLVARSSRGARGLKLDGKVGQPRPFDVARSSRGARGLKHQFASRRVGDGKSRAPHGARVD